jgi:LysR family tcuABC transcriptional regulator
MDLRQMRSFVRVVELGSMSRAALELDMVQSALSQQISRLESELATRLLQRTSRGVSPTEAGLAFFRQAQLTLRHAEEAMRAARQSRLSGSVSVGLAGTTAAVLGLPLMRAMRERYPDVRLHLVESMSGHLTHMLNTRSLDLAILFDVDAQQAARSRWAVQPLLDESLFLIEGLRHAGSAPRGGGSLRLVQLADVALILPTGGHGLRSTVDAAMQRSAVRPRIVAEIDSLSVLMDAVDAGLGATIQPWAAVARHPDAATRFRCTPISDRRARRANALCSLSDEELAPSALAARAVLRDCARELASRGVWQGVRLSA